MKNAKARLKNLFKPEPEAPERPILTVEQIEGVIEAHKFGGSLDTASGHYILCFCGNRVSTMTALRRHVAEQIALLQK